MIGFSNISRKFIINANSQFTSLLQFVWSNIMAPPPFPMFPMSPQLALADGFAAPEMDARRSEDKRDSQKSGSLWDSIIYFAVPKKKISFSFSFSFPSSPASALIVDIFSSIPQGLLFA